MAVRALDRTFDCRLDFDSSTSPVITRLEQHLHAIPSNTGDNAKLSRMIRTARYSTHALGAQVPVEQEADKTA
jgi:hypothetical protein